MRTRRINQIERITHLTTITAMLSALAVLTPRDALAEESPDVPGKPVDVSADKTPDPLAPPTPPAHDVRFGILGGVGFPRPVALGAFLQFDRLWSLGAEISALPATNIDGVNTNFWAAAAEARLHPFKGAFYVGLKTGYQHLSADGYVTTSGVTNFTSGSVETVFINPEAGFLFTWDSGLAIGFGAGLQIPLYADASRSGTLPVTADVLSSVGRLGTGAIPTVDLFRIGLTF